MSKLDVLKIVLKDYINSKYVFKKCVNMYDTDKSRKWLVILEKLEDTKTNEDRKNVIDKNFAKFRANKLKVIAIFNINNPYEKPAKKAILNEYSSNQTLYEVGEIVYADSY